MQRMDDKLVETARADRDRALQLPRLTVADVRDLPCAKRVGLVTRVMQKTADERRHLAFNMQRLTQKLAARGDADPMPVVKAYEALETAHIALGRRIQQLRVVRKHAERACRRR